MIESNRIIFFTSNASFDAFQIAWKPCFVYKVRHLHKKDNDN